MNLTGLLKALERGLCDTDNLVEQMARVEGCDPLDIILEKEKRKETCDILKTILSSLDRKNRRVLWMFINGRTQESIAEKMQVSQQAISKRFVRIYSIIEMNVSSKKLDRLKELLQPNPSVLEASEPDPCGLPYEWLKEIGNGGEWYKTGGYNRFRSKTTCLLPEYFNGSFKDNYTVCNLCKECRRKDKNNKDLLK